tara:strand:+ start:111 stop:482 length:372 start_codon:yes stop_codon:yes gene_type:complete
MITLYDYFRSGAACRTRISLNLKELDYEQVPIHLTKYGGEQFSADHAELNPQNLVPTLIEGDIKITQSMAIMEYIEEAYPDQSLLPGYRYRQHAKGSGRDQSIECRVRSIARYYAERHRYENG